MNRANLWLVLGALCSGAGFALARHQMLVGIVVLAVGMGFFLLTRRERARLDSTRAQQNEPEPD